ncbi:MAG: putative Ubiquitin family protein [Streblomastix strix]|uniref:Putative Ubiquitin family protein n=1 Tax=Streblomastix strix TaxID=222440 RepID=A0A5J4X9V1_9EUKA|nr:MAG: putative Ubiquitin family protein [Streblomastix strix]
MGCAPSIQYPNQSETQCVQAPEKLKIVQVKNLQYIGQKIYIEDIDEQTTMDFVAQQIMNHLKVIGIDLSLVSEYGRKMQFYANSRHVIGDCTNSNVQALTSFLTTGMTCCVESCVMEGCIRIRIEDGNQQFDVDIPQQRNDSVLILKEKINQLRNIVSEKQCISFDKKVLSNEMTLEQCQVKEGDLLTCSTQRRNLRIQMQNGNQINMHFENNEQVHDFCIRACDEAEVEPNLTHFQYNGTPIDKTKLMGELEVDPKCYKVFGEYKVSIHIIISSDWIVLLNNIMNIDTILSVKVQLQSIIRKPVSDIKLLLRGVQLEDQKSLQEYNIRSGDVLEIDPQLPSQKGRPISQQSQQFQRGQFQIFVKTQSGRIITLIVNIDDTIESVKSLIYLQGNYPINEQVLYFGGKQLENNKKIRDYGIKNQNTVYLQFRLRGGDNSSNSQSLPDPIIIPFRDVGPDWRKCSFGLNLEGRCTSNQCVTKRDLVIHKAGFGDFNHAQYESKCPNCGSNMQVCVPGFMQCLFRITYKRINGTVVKIPWRKAVQDYVSYKLKDFGISEFDTLVINTKVLAPPLHIPTNEEIQHEEAERFVVPFLGDCALCMNPQDARDNNVAMMKCGHFFHKLCIANWIARDLLCPLCDAVLEEQQNGT